jgi:hypothetical protein
MPLGERNVPLPPDNDGNEDVLTSQSTNRSTRRPATRAATTHHCPPTRQDGKTSWRLPRETPGCCGDSPVTSRSRGVGYISRSAI